MVVFFSSRPVNPYYPYINKEHHGSEKKPKRYPVGYEHRPCDANLWIDFIGTSGGLTECFIRCVFPYVNSGVVEIVIKSFVFGKTGNKRKCRQRNEETNNNYDYPMSLFSIHRIHTISQATRGIKVLAANCHATMLHNSLTSRQARYTMEKVGGTFMVQNWINEIKAKSPTDQLGMILIHNGIVRATSKDGKSVQGMLLTFDEKLLEATVGRFKEADGVVDIKVWINQGRLSIGDDIMFVLVAGRFRTDVLPVFQELIREIKNNVVNEKEM